MQHVMTTKTVLTKISLAAAVSVLALGALAFSTGPWSEPDNGALNGTGNPIPPGDSFTQHILGSYLGDFPDGSRILLALNPGGSTHRESSDDFIGLSGLPDLPFHFYGGGFGNWTRTGLRTIRIVELAFQFGEDGLVSAISKVTVDVEFNTDLSSARTVAAVAIYLPTQDPLTEEPTAPGPTFEGLLRRIQ